MRFTIRGRLQRWPGDDEFTVTWEEGRLTGDLPAVRRAEGEARAHGTEVLAIAGTGYESDGLEGSHLANYVGAFVLLTRYVFRPGYEFEGDRLPVPRVPPGAIP